MENVHQPSEFKASALSQTRRLDDSSRPRPRTARSRRAKMSSSRHDEFIGADRASRSLELQGDNNELKSTMAQISLISKCQYDDHEIALRLHEPTPQPFMMVRASRWRSAASQAPFTRGSNKPNATASKLSKMSPFGRPNFSSSIVNYLALVVLSMLVIAANTNSNQQAEGAKLPDIYWNSSNPM
jgi:hypothetical protein